jgi:hypothetical protein
MTFNIWGWTHFWENARFFKISLISKGNLLSHVPLPSKRKQQQMLQVRKLNIGRGFHFWENARFFIISLISKVNLLSRVRLPSKRKQQQMLQIQKINIGRVGVFSGKPQGSFTYPSFQS